MISSAIAFPKTILDNSTNKNKMEQKQEKKDRESETNKK
jgi:hypothetical protein